MQHLPVSVEAAIAVAVLVAIVALGALVRALRGRRREALREPEAPAPVPPAAGRVLGALAKTRDALRRRLGEVFGRDRELGAMLASLEEVLLAADVGMPTTTRILQTVRDRCGSEREPGEARVRDALREAIQEALGETLPRTHDSKPWVILVSGVNGVGKTTSIGKLAARFAAAGDRVLLVAADTFRAAAIDQLGVWAERVGADLVRHQSGADPAAVAFDGVKAAAARDADVVIVDTAGRLHTRENLMEELRKVTRVIGKAIPGAPHEVWLVLDATTGQNAIHQAKVFSEALGVTGIVLTKLDGTAKGGAALAVRQELGVPIVWLGVGESIDDIRPFSASEFASALLGED
jgi:fused signal recognition particle receptor